MGDSEIGFSVRRYPADVSVTVLERTGDVSIVVVKWARDRHRGGAELRVTGAIR